MNACFTTDELMTKDPKRKFFVVKFVAEWIEKLAVENLHQNLNTLIEKMFLKCFNAESSSEINITLLEILHYYQNNE
jgi:hypothetical protein